MFFRTSACDALEGVLRVSDCRPVNGLVMRPWHEEREAKPMHQPGELYSVRLGSSRWPGPVMSVDSSKVAAAVTNAGPSDSALPASQHMSKVRKIIAACSFGLASHTMAQHLSHLG